eukprot:c4059_g1_i1 orf=263-763(-)
MLSISIKNHSISLGTNHLISPNYQIVINKGRPRFNFHSRLACQKVFSAIATYAEFSETTILNFPVKERIAGPAKVARVPENVTPPSSVTIVIEAHCCNQPLLVLVDSGSSLTSFAQFVQENLIPSTLCPKKVSPLEIILHLLSPLLALLLKLIMLLLLFCHNKSFL